MEMPSSHIGIYEKDTLPFWPYFVIKDLFALAVILVVFSVLSLWASFLFMRGKEYATVQKGGGGMAKRSLKPAEKVLAYGAVIFILLLVGQATGLITPHGIAG